MQGNGATAAVRRRKTKTLPSGRTIELAQLTFRDFAQIREEACERFKSGLIRTYTRNMALVPEEQRSTIIDRAFERAEKITPDDIPKKRAWLPKRDGEGRPVRHRGEKFYHSQAKVWVADGDPIPEEQDMDYANWWMSYSPDGQVYAAWLSARKCPGQETMTLDDIDQMFMDAAEALDEVANTIGELSEPRLGNAEAASLD